VSKNVGSCDSTGVIGFSKPKSIVGLTGSVGAGVGVFVSTGCCCLLLISKTTSFAFSLENHLDLRFLKISTS